MAIFQMELLSLDDHLTSDTLLHFGWSDEEVAEHTRQRQSLFIGDSKDLALKGHSEDGETYYYIFRGLDDVYRFSDVAFLFDEPLQLLLVCINARLYRLCLKTQSLISTAKINAYFSEAFTLPEKGLMLVWDEDGIYLHNVKQLVKQFEHPEPCSPQLYTHRVNDGEIHIETCALERQFILSISAPTAEGITLRENNP